MGYQPLSWRNVLLNWFLSSPNYITNASTTLAFQHVGSPHLLFLSLRTLETLLTHLTTVLSVTFHFSAKSLKWLSTLHPMTCSLASNMVSALPLHGILLPYMVWRAPAVCLKVLDKIQMDMQCNWPWSGISFAFPPSQMCYRFPLSFLQILSC